MRDLKPVVFFIVAFSLLSQFAFAGRYYDPEIGRFTTPDPALQKHSPQELAEMGQGQLLRTSPYAYANNNPLRYVDPDGNTPWDVVDIVSLGMSINDFRKDPSWANAGWVAADVVGALPLLPSVGLIRHAGKLAGKADNVIIPIAEGFIKRGGNYYADSKTVNALGSKLKFGKLNSKVTKVSDAMWDGKKTGGKSTSIVYTNDKGETIAVVHQVTDAKGNIVHRDFDAVRIESGQMINKDKTLDKKP